MVIDSNNNIPPSAGNSRNRVDARPLESKSGHSNQEPPSPVVDGVSLSAQAKLMQKLESQIDAAPDVNAERVANIKKALAEGTYEINAERVAERMLDQDQLF